MQRFGHDVEDALPPGRRPPAGLLDEHRHRARLVEEPQAARLGVAIDAADAMRKGISADALRRSVLNALAARADATSVIAAAPSTPTPGDSPIVRRARERAVAAQT